MKRKMFTMCELSPSCMEEIRHSVLVQHFTYKEAAAKHMVKPSLVQTIMSSIKKDPEFISKRVQKMEKKQEQKEMVETYVETKLSRREPIESILEVYEAVNAKLGTNLK